MTWWPSLLDLWPWKSTGHCTQPRCICVWNFVKLCQSIHGWNVTTSFKHEYKRHTLTSRCDVISDVMNTKNTFYVIKKTGSCTGSWVQEQDRPCHSLHFEILFDGLAQILSYGYFKIWLTFWPRDLVIWPLIYKTIRFCVVIDYICGLSLVMIGQKLPPVLQKMWQFHLNMNIEDTLWRHVVTSLVTSSLWKSFW